MAFNTYEVGEITGQEYNDVWKKWFNKKLSIWVGIDNEDNKEYIFFQGDTGLGNATVSIQNLEGTIEQLKEAVKKAIEWSDIARKNQADVSKNIRCFNLCAEKPYRGNQMSMSFFAANSGKQTNLIIMMIDRSNHLIKTTIYVNLLEMKKLLMIIGKIEDKFKKARKTAKDQNLFK